jgi:cytochrome c553
MMMVGGESVRSIHGSHFGPGVSIRYASTDSTRQTIPWVEYRNSNTNEVRSYAIESVQPDAGKLLSYAMQCVDCHNRPTHTFELPEPAVNRAMALGRIPVSLPFIKKTALQALQVKYASSEEAGQKIPVAIRDYYRKEQSATYQSRSGDVEAAANAVLTIYNNNVFPDLGVTWGTYKNNLGHMDFPGCFRCHDEAHTSASGKTITQDCATCHEVVASSEATPEVLKTLGLQERISNLQKK